MARVDIDAALCRKCYSCTRACPAKILLVKEKGLPPQTAWMEFCIECGHCAAVCPTGSLSHDSYPEGTVHPVSAGMLPSGEQVLEFLRARRSVRVFKDRPVEVEVIEKVIDAARYAPSAHNSQSTGYIAVRGATIDRVAELTAGDLEAFAERLAGTEPGSERVRGLKAVVMMFRHGVDLILRGAPAVIVFHGPRDDLFSRTNSVLALHNATLAATGMGLGSFYIGYVEMACRFAGSVPPLLSVPSGREVQGVMGLGYPDITYEKYVERRPPDITWM